MSLRVSVGFVTLVFACMAPACGGSLPPADDASAVAAISAAETSGAEEVPQAALYLRMAKDGVARARTQIADGREEQARETLERAAADAQLARTLTTESKVRSQADMAAQSVEQLKSRTTTF